MRYREAGVDIERSDAIKQSIDRAVRGTWGNAVRRLPAGFAGLIEFPSAEGTGRRLLAATMDGVGTKLHLALAAGRVRDAAADLVHHCANDLLVHGAEPLAFLDYLAQARLDPERVRDLVEGMARACGEVGAALIGGETAEMPDTYLEGVVDVAGCMLGTVDGDRVLDGSAVRPGDVLIGLASNGLHTNGYSLARKVLSRSGLALDAPLPSAPEVSVSTALLASHRWYGPALRSELGHPGLHALAHVTGGGIAGNLIRALPEGTRARVDPAVWSWPPVFRWLVDAGAIPLEDARRAFNLGVGMIAIGDAGESAALLARLTARGERAWKMGEVVAGAREVEWT